MNEYVEIDGNEMNDDIEIRWNQMRLDDDSVEIRWNQMRLDEIR